MTTSARPTLLVTDLDNTVWDWFDVWYRSFNALLDSLTEMTGIPRDVLEQEIRAVHQRRHTSEYSYLVNEVPSLISAAGKRLPSDVFDAAIHRQNSERLHAMRLYEGVIETILFLRDRGVMIAAYTESVAYWTEWRIRKTGLDGLIDVLYSAEDHDFPAGVSVDDIRMSADSEYGLRLTKHIRLPLGVLKPNREILRSIIAHCGRTPAETVYVGDSIMKDVAMAQEVGAVDVWAKYGAVQHRAEYELLRRVTHWSTEDVEREKEIAKRPPVTPTFTLDSRFEEITPLF